MSITTKQELLEHLGHKIIIAYYGDPDDPESVCVECDTCNKVLYSEEDDIPDESFFGTCDHGVSLTHICEECKKR